MANRIGYNNKTIDFPRLPYEVNPPDYPVQANRNHSLGGVMETITERIDCAVNIKFRWLSNVSDATLKRNLKQWWMWAQSGRQWTFARDHTQTVNTTITARASALATSVTVNNAASIIAGGLYVIRSATRLEVVRCDSIASNVVTLTEPLNFEYASGSRFRSELYWPGATVSNVSPIIERPPLWYDVELNFIEDLRDI